MSGENDRTPRTSATRDQILEASESFFLKNGYRGITMTELARLAGVSKKTLYVYFRDKSQILEEVIDRRLSYLYDELEKVRAENEGHGIICFIEVFSRWQEVLAEVEPPLWRELQMDSERFFMQTAQRRDRLVHGIFERIIRDGIRDGTCRPDIDPFITTEIMLAAIEGLIRSGKCRALGLTPRKLIVTLGKTMIEGTLTNEGRAQMLASEKFKAIQNRLNDE